MNSVEHKPLDISSSFTNLSGLLQQVTHGAIQFTAYEELRKVVVNWRSDENERASGTADNLLVRLKSCPCLFLWI